jgi:hypothetical protein
MIQRAKSKDIVAIKKQSGSLLLAAVTMKVLSS